MTDIQKQKIKHLRLDGKSYKDIAAAMKLNENNVKTYCSRNGLTDKDVFGKEKQMSVLRSKNQSDP